MNKSFRVALCVVVVVVVVVVNIYAIEDYFRVYIALAKHERGWENSRQLFKPETQSRVCITFKNSPSPLSV